MGVVPDELLLETARDPWGSGACSSGVGRDGEGPLASPSHAGHKWQARHQAENRPIPALPT